jgi:hypothetical protein
MHFWNKRPNATHNQYFSGIRENHDYCLNLYLKNDDDWEIGVNLTDTLYGNPSYFQNDTFYYVTTWCERGVEARCSVNDSGTIGYSYAYTTGSADNAEPFVIGREATVNDTYSHGLIDEIRISFAVRNESYINATFHTINQSEGFITGDLAGIGQSIYSILGLTYDRVTWGGMNNTVAWCNSSGQGNEWMDINMQINYSDNVSEIRVWAGDLNDTGADIGASNITLYVSSDNSSYGILNHDAGYGTGKFPENGGNLSINETTFPAGGGTNPFTGEGLTDKTASIYCVFRLEIPADQVTSDYFNSTAWRVYIGRWV